ncbi:helix-turn-helix transcriptional regulator [Limnohabitans sp. Bal53]|uniref:helix-turn-helix transcriptional regulator n=1 Tax=Limnohabitans sp. Bal53 TaxID=1977910 RepID=UPI000D34C95B|nr:helix-turn-helix transcriptional regulator [Limnohabitans sp. Bal53]
MTDAAAFTAANFVNNLKLACSYYPSVSEVARKVGINRQQFMRYLSSESYPSRHNLRKLCDLFGVDEFELLMPVHQFRNLLRLKKERDEGLVKLPPLLPPLLQLVQRQRAELSKNLGYFHVYYLSASRPGSVLKSLIHIYEWQEFTLYKRIERLKVPGSKGQAELYKYSGMVGVVGDRLHLIDQETLTGSELTHTILYPSYRNRITYLTGLTVGVSGNDAHRPSASRIALEYAGNTVNLRRAIADCGLFAPEDPAVPAIISRYLCQPGEADVVGQLQASPL